MCLFLAECFNNFFDNHIFIPESIIQVGISKFRVNIHHSHVGASVEMLLLLLLLLLMKKLFGFAWNDES